MAGAPFCLLQRSVSYKWWKYQFKTRNHIAFNVGWWHTVCYSACGLRLRGTCCTCPPWGRSWPTMKTIQTPGWSAISLWTTTTHRWASDCTQIFFGFQTHIAMDLLTFQMNDNGAAAHLNSPLSSCSRQAGVSVPKSTLPWSARRSSAHQREIKRSAETTSCVKSPTSPMVCVCVRLGLNFTTYNS